MKSTDFATANQLLPMGGWVVLRPVAGSSWLIYWAGVLCGRLLSLSEEPTAALLVCCCPHLHLHLGVTCTSFSIVCDGYRWTLFCFVLLMGLGFELRALHLQSRHSTAQIKSLVHFALVILEVGSHELFAQTGFKL
jgi:hypothetical protein